MMFLLPKSEATREVAVWLFVLLTFVVADDRCPCGSRGLHQAELLELRAAFSSTLRRAVVAMTTISTQITSSAPPTISK